MLAFSNRGSILDQNTTQHMITLYVLLWSSIHFHVQKTVHQAAQEEAAALLSAEATEVAALVEALKERRKRVANENNMVRPSAG